MSKFPRRKFITTGLAVTAGASGLAVAARLAQSYPASDRTGEQRISERGAGEAPSRRASSRATGAAAPAASFLSRRVDRSGGRGLRGRPEPGFLNARRYSGLIPPGADAAPV